MTLLNVDDRPTSPETPPVPTWVLDAATAPTKTIRRRYDAAVAAIVSARAEHHQAHAEFLAATIDGADGPAPALHVGVDAWRQLRAAVTAADISIRSAESAATAAWHELAEAIAKDTAAIAKADEVTANRRDAFITTYRALSEAYASLREISPTVGGVFHGYSNRFGLSGPRDGADLATALDEIRQIIGEPR